MVSNLVHENGAGQAPAPGLHATVSGEGAPVLLIHGLFGMGSNLGSLAKALADGYEVHQLDLPNHGRSPWSDTMDLHDLAVAVVAYARDLESPVSVVGHSLGGKTAMQMALAYPDVVRSVVVADIAPVAYGPSHDAVFAAIGEVRNRAPRSRSEAGEILSRSIVEEGVRQFLLLSLRRDDDGIYRWRFNARALESNYESLRRAPVGAPYTGPSLFLYGGRSSYVSSDGIEEAKRLFPQAQFACIDDSGHWLHAEKPKEFNGAVREFLDICSKGSLP